MTAAADAGKPQVTICGLGPGSEGHITEETARLLAGPEPVFLRTTHHPGASRFPSASSFDHVYETAASFEEVYRTITATVVGAAEADGHVVFAVPGSPLVLERSVRYLRTSDQIDVRLLPAVSFLDEAWARLGVDPIEQSVRLVDGLTFATDAAGERGPLLVAHTHASWVLSDIKLSLDVGPEQKVVVLQRLGTDEERIFEVGWPDLDRSIEADHLTTLYIPELVAPVGQELAASAEMMRRLRRDCPWDREQTHGSLRKYLIEEAYEVLEALDRLSDGPSDAGPLPRDQSIADRYEDLEEELGDLWFQILFHTELAAEAGQFTLADVARGLREKMVRRHPHVYAEDGGTPVAGADPTSDDLRATWESQKLAEKGRRSILDGIPTGLPALSLAEKTLKKADGVGARPELGERGAAVRASLSSTGGDHVTAHDVGETLLAVVELARRDGIDSEQALRAVTKRAAERFRALERTEATDLRWIAG